jgi:hypothetical protein
MFNSYKIKIQKLVIFYIYSNFILFLVLAVHSVDSPGPLLTLPRQARASTKEDSMDKPINESMQLQIL